MLTFDYFVNMEVSEKIEQFLLVQFLRITSPLILGENNMETRSLGSLVIAGLACSLLAAAPAQATLYGGVDFPQGAISFADEVVSYSPTQPGVIDPIYMVQDNALGAPNGASVTLGSNGSIVLKFTDNFLTGSGDNTDDLWIFEIGPDVESTFVWLSKDGTNWLSIGGIGGSTRGIDIDAFGYGTADQFSYIMLQDDPNQGDTGPPSPGADIDAVGAISTVRQLPPTGAPEPATLALLGAGIAGLGFQRKKRKA